MDCGGNPDTSRYTPLETTGTETPVKTNVTDEVTTTSIPSVIQFAAPMYLCTEAEGNLTVEVVRIGDVTGTASVFFATQDASAKAGQKFVGYSATLVFQPGEHVKEVSIELLQDERWDATLEFKMALSEVSGAQLGLYLHACRAKIIDDDNYPTNKYSDRLTGLSLMAEYVKMNLGDPVIFRDTIKHIMMDLLKGMYFFLTLYLTIYLIDVVLAPREGQEHEGHGGEHGSEGEHEGGHHKEEERRMLLSGINATARFIARRLHEEGGEEEEEEVGFIPHELIIPHHRRYTAMVIAALYIVPFVFLHLVDYFRVQMNIPYCVRKTTQSSLLAKFLNYKEAHRQNINIGEITMTMMRDAVEVCDFGYMKILSVIGILLKLFFALIFIMAENKLAVIPLICYPVVLGIFLYCRERITIEANEDKAKKQDEVVQVVNEAVTNYRLIADFALRPSIVDGYAKAIERLHGQEKVAQAIVTNNMYMAPWLTTLLIGAWMVYGSLQVETLGGPLTLGAFIATINVFKEVGMEMQEIYIECMEIQKSFGPLEKICYYMNLDTDLFDRMNASRKMLAHGSVKQQESETRKRSNSSSSKSSRTSPKNYEHADSHAAFTVDTIDIELNKLSFNYDGCQVLENMSAQFHQGGLYAFVGPPHEGKGTLMKVLGKVLLPEDDGGTVFIPPHLRVLHLSMCECLINDTLMQNLLLYTPIEKVLGGIDRVKRICKLLGMQEKILVHIDEDTPMKTWASFLSHTDYARLNLARAFIMNPECLVIHKPDMVFSSDEVTSVMELLRKHVNERGLELPEKTRAVRRPRTVFFTSVTIQGVNFADRVFEVKHTGHGHRSKPLQVKIISGKGLPNTDTAGITGKSDPYCLCLLVGKPKTRLTTSTANNTLDPVWNFSGEIPFYVNEDVLKFCVYDSDDLKDDDFLGEAFLALKDLDSTGFAGELELMKCPKGAKATIKVQVKPCPEHGLDVNPSELRPISQAEVRDSAKKLKMLE